MFAGALPQDQQRVVLSGAAEIYRSFGDNHTQIAAFHGIPADKAKIIQPYVKEGNEEAIQTALAQNPDWLYLWEMLYGGVRSGKTFAIAFRVWMTALMFPGVKILVIRKRKEQLRNTFLDEFEKVGNLMTGGHVEWIGRLCPERDGALEYEVFSDSRFPSKVIFAIEPDLGTDSEIEKRWLGYTVFAVVTEESAQLRKVSIDMPRIRVSQERDAYGNSIGNYRWMATILNPVNEGQHFLDKLRAECELAYAEGKRPRCLVIRSRPRDNAHHLPQNYEAEIRESLADDPIKLQMMLDGNPGLQIDGKPVYGRQWNPNIHIDKEIRFNPYKPLLVGMDFGYHHPAAIFAQESLQGGINVLSEIIGTDMTAEQFGRQILTKIATEMPATRATFYGDPAGAQKTDKGDSTIAILMRMGIRTNFRPTSIDAGILHVRGMLTHMVGGRPELVFHPACAETILAFERGYHYKKFADGTFGDKPYKDGRFDHPADAIRYLLVNVRNSMFQAEESDLPMGSGGNPMKALVLKGPQPASMD